MRALILLSVLASIKAQGQALRSYPGDRPSAAVSGGAGSTTPLPATFAWYGDSIVQGTCNGTPPPVRLGQLLPGYLAVNRGISGENVAQITTRYLANFATDCAGEPCGTYIFEGMTNDCGTGTCDVPTVIATMLTAVDHARAQGFRVLWFNGPPNLTCEEVGCVGGTAAGVAKMLEYRAAMQTACVARPDVRCIDAYAALEDPTSPGALLEAYRCSSLDRVHTSQAGADVLADLAAAAPGW